MFFKNKLDVRYFFAKISNDGVGHFQSTNFQCRVVGKSLGKHFAEKCVVYNNNKKEGGGRVKTHLLLF